MCRGNNDEGQLGVDGTRMVGPVAVAGARHAGAIIDGGALECCGTNDAGALGHLGGWAKVSGGGAADFVPGFGPPR